MHLPELYLFDHGTKFEYSNTSPFWRSRPAAPRRTASSSVDLTKVIGASYSYADMMNLDALYVLGEKQHQAMLA